MNLRSLLSVATLAGLLAGVRAQDLLGNGCLDIPLALQNSGQPATGLPFAVGNPLPPGQNWMGILVIGTERLFPLAVFDPAAFSCMNLATMQPAPVYGWVDPIGVYFFVDTGGTVTIPVPPGLAGLSFAAQGAYGQASLRVTQGLRFTVQ